MNLPGWTLAAVPVLLRSVSDKGLAQAWLPAGMAWASDTLRIFSNSKFGNRSVRIVPHH